MIQSSITPAAGKRLIARSIIRHNAVSAALESNTVVIVAGTTNGYVAEELLAACGERSRFSCKRFFRGITLPPYQKITDSGRLPDQSGFPGDGVIQKGSWLKGKNIFDVVGELKEGDIILKGANAVDLLKKQAGVLIGDLKGGTITAALQAVVGRRVRLILPVGLEKRVSLDLNTIASLLNTPGARGARMLPVPGEVVTELEAVNILTGASAELVAAGGVCGAEGTVWLAISGTPEQEAAAKELLNEIRKEPNFML
ncbi:MAG: hypothetical protein GX846_01300 [Deltaproteobacteria bacterium]|nr:hypothetical protein [Deltaproteobacteria bacterium]